ncbi:inositol-tetrakisphosphate 1-kinase 1 [Beta vulgaris subsp. vulgaris]|uniref:inositol-tetrakisphosphate 1-kinase 1 n=1 Tax=Beta vulgaris subsp. vulgaris TaxID=3555 RepID=UPI002036A501|nr:inositol-tetrakisphosphate 1-kinase 1 [Beta vulgaris subsp. vulgaris]
MGEEKQRNVRISVGYALPPNKVNTFIIPSLLTHAKNKGIDLILIDHTKPLLQQGPFDCIVHKLYNDDWDHQLLEFKSKHPYVPVIDSPSAIRRLHNRVSMLEVVNNLSIPTSSFTIGVPNQILMTEQCQEEGINFRFPVIAKPLIANGTPNSHQMSLVFNSDGLKKVKEQAPVVVQEFVNHGGVLFKVYVAGNHVKCVQRKSLPDIHISDDHPVFESVLPFSQISSLPAKFDDDEEEETISMPSLDFINNLVGALRKATQLHLFNFDVIRDTSDCNGNKFLIIDINYFPGYAKLPGFEEMLTDFFWDVVNNKQTVDQDT